MFRISWCLGFVFVPSLIANEVSGTLITLVFQQADPYLECYSHSEDRVSRKRELKWCFRLFARCPLLFVRGLLWLAMKPSRGPYFSWVHEYILDVGHSRWSMAKGLISCKLLNSLDLLKLKNNMFLCWTVKSYQLWIKIGLALVEFVFLSIISGRVLFKEGGDSFALCIASLGHSMVSA